MHFWSYNDYSYDKQKISGSFLLLYSFDVELTKIYVFRSTI